MRRGDHCGAVEFNGHGMLRRYALRESRLPVSLDVFVAPPRLRPLKLKMEKYLEEKLFLLFSLSK